MGEHSPCGANVAAAIIPVDRALPLVAATSEPIAASWTHVPMSEAVPAPQNRRNPGCRSGRIPWASTCEHASDFIHERTEHAPWSFVTVRTWRMSPGQPRSWASVDSIRRARVAGALAPLIDSTKERRLL